jgi:hypothetical protein
MLRIQTGCDERFRLGWHSFNTHNALVCSCDRQILHGVSVVREVFSIKDRSDNSFLLNKCFNLCLQKELPCLRFWVRPVLTIDSRSIVL